MAHSLNAPIVEAQKVLSQYNITSAPVDVEGICKKLDIRIARVSMDEIEQLVHRKISGAIQKRPGSTCTILINECDINTRARFTIAHELGHFFLHMKDSENKVITSFRMDHSPQEREADRFAAELLMPERLVREEYERLLIPVSDSLAKAFDVSKQAMRVRLDTLELMYV